VFNPTQLVIDAYVQRLQDNYRIIYGHLEPAFPEVLGFAGRLALENIANSDAPYHDVNHTILVTEVGQEILKGKQLSEGGVSARDWLHFGIALLCHDIGYVRGVCRDDHDGGYVINAEEGTVTVPRGATDASLTPYHVARLKLLVNKRFGRIPFLDATVVEQNIKFTRFPVPAEEEYSVSNAYPALLRAADLIGQMADINYLRKIGELFREFEETGANKKFGYTSTADLRTSYPAFFWNVVSPLIHPALRYLRVTQEGKMWINNLYANVFIEEHKTPAGGAER